LLNYKEIICAITFEFLLFSIFWDSLSSISDIIIELQDNTFAIDIKSCQRGVTMKNILICFLMVVLLSCPAFADTPEYIEGEVLVVISAPMSAFSAKGAVDANAFSEAVLSQAEAFANEFGLEAINSFPEIARISGKSIIHLSSEYKSTEEMIQELSTVSYVEGVYPNCIMKLNETPAAESMGSYSFENRVPNDPSYSQQWGMKAIEMETVWDDVTGSDTVCVAVFDTGIDYNHPDISANMAKDSSGFYGKYFKNGITTNDPMDKSSRSHGTHIAGIIGAVGNNGIGVAGVNWSVKMLAVNVMPDELATESDTIAGIEYVLSEKNKGLNIRVANISFGGWNTQADSSPFGRAVKSLSDAGINCVMAVGNDSLNISNPGRSGRVYPACFRFDHTISVGSTSYGNGKASHSNYSTEWVDIAAPGDQIYSTILNSGYGVLTGTSMATPHVAGAAAILIAARPNESPTQIKARILNGAKKIGVTEGYWKSGVLDVAGAYHYSEAATLKVSFQGRVVPNAANIEKLTVKWISGNVVIAEETVTTDQNAEAGIVIPSNAPLTIWVKGERTLAVSQHVGEVENGSVINVGTLPGGDANDDNMVDLKDFNIFLISYGKNSYSPEYNQLADFNKDGVVDLSDFGILSSNYGRVGAQLSGGYSSSSMYMMSESGELYVNEPDSGRGCNMGIAGF
jgi:subtilisin family serine protease